MIILLDLVNMLEFGSTVLLKRSRVQVLQIIYLKKVELLNKVRVKEIIIFFIILLKDILLINCLMILN